MPVDREIRSLLVFFFVEPLSNNVNLLAAVQCVLEHSLSLFLRVYQILISIICRFDDGQDGFLDLSELKRMMEVLGAPQTHLGLKSMIQEVDEDRDGRISFREVRDFTLLRQLLYREITPITLYRIKSSMEFQ